MAYKTIETEGSKVIVSDDQVAKKLNPASLIGKFPTSVLGGPQEFGEIKTGFEAGLKDRALQRYKTIHESNTQFSFEVVFRNKKQEKEAKTVDGILHSFKCEKSKLVGFFMDLHGALGVTELFAGNYNIKVRNIFIETPKEKYKFKKIETINYVELREIVDGTVLVMISFA